VKPLPFPSISIPRLGCRQAAKGIPVDQLGLEEAERLFGGHGLVLGGHHGCQISPYRGMSWYFQMDLPSGILT